MYQRVYLLCYACKCEFHVETHQLTTNPQRSCPNCGQVFDYVGISTLAEGLARLADASGTVQFRLPSDKGLADLHRLIKQLVAAAQEPG
ncbi:MAG: hypothetical protein PVH68_11735 [Armatimonadota bacterium]